MKKLFTFVAATLCAVAMSAEVVTIDCVSAFSGKGTSGTGSEVTYTQDGVTFTCDKGYGDGQYGVRCYQGSTITISATQNIVKIEFEFGAPSGNVKDGGLDQVVCVGATEWSSGALPSQARLNGNLVITLGEGSCEGPVVEEITVAQALEIGAALADGATTTEKYVVKGYVVKAYDFDTQYKNQSFYMSDDASAERGDFFAKWTTGDVVQEGNFVAVTGYIEKYLKEGASTIQVLRGEAKVLPTAVENVTVAPQVTKMIENGQVVIIRNGVRYNSVGTVIE